MVHAHHPLPSMGQEVYTTDGHRLGHVKELRGIAFKVDAPMELDYWLPVSSTASVAVDRVTVQFNLEELGTYKMGDWRDIAGTAAAEET